MFPNTLVKVSPCVSESSLNITKGEIKLQRYRSLYKLMILSNQIQSLFLPSNERVCWIIHKTNHIVGKLCNVSCHLYHALIQYK